MRQKDGWESIHNLVVFGRQTSELFPKNPRTFLNPPVPTREHAIWNFVVSKPRWLTEQLKGIIRVFSKMLELFSGRCRWRWLTATTKGLFSQNCLTCKCQPFKVDSAASRYFCEQLASTLSDIPISHWLNIGWRLFNDWLRISRYQISAHFTR